LIFFIQLVDEGLEEHTRLGYSITDQSQRFLFDRIRELDASVSEMMVLVRES
jgi:predicted transcriptional regulator